DRFRAGFTLRNAASAAQHVSVTAAATTQTGKALPALAAQTFDLAAGTARDIGWDIDVPVDAGALRWRVDAGSGSGAAAASDALAVKVDVVPAVAARTYQATLSQLSEPVSMQVARPVDAIAGRGGIDVTLQAHLADSLPGVDEYLHQYPYSCFEQRVSVALGLRDRDRWDAAMRAMPAFIDDDGLVKYFAFMRNGDDVLTAYVLSVSDAAGYAIPAALRSRLESGLIGFVEGRVVRYGALPTADLALRKLAALAALAHRHAAFPPRWLDSIVIAPNLWPTSAVLDWHSILKHVPELPRRDLRLAEAERILRARLNFQGTTMGFSTEKSDALWWLMVSADSNANRMLFEMADEPAWREDIPRLARGALGRMQRGHWNTTVANAWGIVAMQKFSETFESTPVTGAATAALGTDTFRQPFSGDEANAHFIHRFAWPPTPAPLALTYQGSGKPWVSVASIAAIPLTSPLSSGYQLMRRVAPVQQKVAGRWSAGDIARVTLDIDAQSDMTWVVISDPVPAGASLLGRGFGTESTLATTDEQREGHAWPAFEERTATAFNAYYRLLPKGRISIDYTLRLNNAGTFVLPGTRAEAMYAPEMFGELPLSQWVVAP
ncbi:MAG: alpha-2-macroglobulin, partial [Casimicrobiaceae bacterium]